MASDGVGAAWWAALPSWTSPWAGTWQPFSTDFVSRHNPVEAAGQPAARLLALAGLSAEQYLKRLLCAAVLSEAVYQAEFVGATRDERGMTACLNALNRDYPSFFDAERFQPSRRQSYIIVEFREFLCVVFRGTVDANDWDGNLDLETVRCAELNRAVHRGFLESARDVALHALRAASRNLGKPIVFAGHSRGAAVAEICARLYAAEFPPAAGAEAGRPANWLWGPAPPAPVCITFGQPHVFSADGNLADESVPVFRYVFSDDVVPGFLDSFGYTSSGIVLNLVEEPDRTSDYAVCIGRGTSGGPPNIPASFQAFITDLVSTASAVSPNHRMRRYRASVLRGNGATSAIPGAPARTVRASDIVPPAATGIFDPNDAQVSVGFSNARVVVELLFPGAERLPALDFTRAEARLTVFDAGSGTAREVDLVAWPRYGLDAEKGKLVMTADFLLPPNTIPEEAEMQLVLSSSLRSDELRRRLSLDLRNVWLMGPTGAGKTQLAACLNALAKHGPFAQEFLQCRTRRRGVTPAVTGETFHARGIRFVELPGMQFDTETERLALFDRLAEVPPHLVLVVFDGHAGIVSTGGDGGRGLPAQVAALRTQMRGIADKVSELAAAESKRDGAGPGDGQKPQQLADIGAQIAWVFTKWGFVDPDDRAEKERELRAALGATDGERSFCVNAGCDRNTSRIEGAVELFDYIQSAVHRASSAGQADVFRFFRRAWFAAGVWVRRNVTPQHVAAVGVAAAAVAVAPPMGTMTEVVTFVVPALLRIFRIRLG